MKREKDQYLGCLIGLAVGDALGAPVEFLSLSEIKRRYGENGISDFSELGGFDPGSYSEKIQKIAIDMYRAFRKGEKLPFDEYPPSPNSGGHPIYSKL